MADQKGEYVKDYIKTIKHGMNYYKQLEDKQKTKNHSN